MRAISTARQVIDLRSLLRLFWQERRFVLWFPLYLAIFVVLERVPSGGYWATQLPLDRRIPFCPFFVVLYCTWYPFWVVTGLYLLKHHRDAFRRYMRFLALTFFLSELIWILVPNGQDLRPHILAQDDFFSAVLSALYRIDTNTNVFPSVHVLGAVGAALALWDALGRQRPWLCTGWTVLAVLISLSTLFVKQHSLLDVTGGLVLSLLVGLPLYGKRRQALVHSYDADL